MYIVKNRNLRSAIKNRVRRRSTSGCNYDNNTRMRTGGSTMTGARTR